jgi:hypothetical protein
MGEDAWKNDNFRWEQTYQRNWPYLYLHKSNVSFWYPGYSIDYNFLNNFNSYFAKRTPSEEALKYITDVINLFLVPIVCFISMTLNGICVSVFSNKKFRSTLYRFLLVNSAIDFVTLFFALIGSFVKITETSGAEFNINSSAQYFFVFISYTTLTASNFIKIAMSFDRIFRLKQICKFYAKKWTFIIITFFVLVFSIGANIPKLIFQNLISYEWRTTSYLTVTLTYFGKHEVAGLVVIFSSLLLEFIPIIAIIILNIVLFIAAKKHLKKLESMENNAVLEQTQGETTKMTPGQTIKKIIFFDIYNEDSEDEKTADVMMIANIENDSSIGGGNSSIHITRSSSSTVAQESKTESVNTQHENKTDIQMAKYLLTRMIQINCLVYLIGHAMFALCSVYIQIKYFFYYGPLMNLFQERYIVFNFIMALSYLLLYGSFGANFFVYYKFNGSFKKIFNEGEKKDDLPLSKEGESRRKDEDSLDYILRTF